MRVIGMRVREAGTGGQEENAARGCGDSTEVWRLVHLTEPYALC